MHYRLQWSNHLAVSDSPEKVAIKMVHMFVAVTLDQLLKQENIVLEFWTTRKRRIDQCQQYVVLETSAKQVLSHTRPFYGPFFRDHPGEPVPEENLWTLWCKGRLTEADTETIRLVATPSGLTSADVHHPPHFLQAGCASCCPTNSVKALKATSAFGLGRRC